MIGRRDNDPATGALAAELADAAERDYQQLGVPAMAKIPARVRRAQRRAKAAAAKRAAK